MDWILSFGFVSGVVASLVAQGLWLVLTERIPAIAEIIGALTIKGHTLSGIWAVDFESGGYQNKQNTEIYRLRHFGREKVTFSYDHYSNYRPQPQRGKGYGIYRSHYFAALYYPLAKEEVEVGTLILKEQNKALIGMYAHYRDRDRSEIESPYLFASEPDILIMSRVKLPFSARMRSLYGKAYFPDFDEAAWYVRNQLTKQIQPTSSVGG
jgi:hypothetical protein